MDDPAGESLLEKPSKPPKERLLGMELGLVDGGGSQVE